MSDRKRKRQEYRGEHREKHKAAGQHQSKPVPPVWPIGQGWKVYTSDQAALGTVAAAPDGEPYFVVRRGLLLRRTTLYVPLRFVRGAGEGRVMLRATKAQALTWKQRPAGRRPAAVDDAEQVLTSAAPPPARPVALPAGTSHIPLSTGRVKRSAPPPVRAPKATPPDSSVPPSGAVPSVAAANVVADSTPALAASQEESQVSRTQEPVVEEAHTTTAVVPLAASTPPSTAPPQETSATELPAEPQLESHAAAAAGVEEQDMRRSEEDVQTGEQHAGDVSPEPGSSADAETPAP